MNYICINGICIDLHLIEFLITNTQCVVSAMIPSSFFMISKNHKYNSALLLLNPPPPHPTCCSFPLNFLQSNNTFVLQFTF